MPNPMHFDSDWDYYNACMSPSQRVAQSITDGERELNEYLEWGALNYPELTPDDLVANESLIDKYAEHVIEIDAMNQEPS